MAAARPLEFGPSYATEIFDPLDDGDEFRAVYVHRPVFAPFSFEMQRVTGPVHPIKGCCVGNTHTVTLEARSGPDQRQSKNNDGQFGVYDNNVPCGGLRLPAPLVDATDVYAGSDVTFARCGDNTMLGWGRPDLIGRDGPAAVPAAVEGLPPVRVFAMGTSWSIAITTGDEAYTWGYPDRALQAFSDRYVPRPVLLGALSGRRVCSLCLGKALSVAVTRERQLLVWGLCLDGECGPQPVLLRPTEMRFPLRTLAVRMSVIYAADAAGTLWQIDEHCRLTAAWLKRRVVELASAEDYVVALTEEGELWHTSICNSWCRIGAARRQRPLGLVPYGGATARQVLLAPDYCGGKCRLRVFARIAMRIGMPSDPLRDVLPPFVVPDVYITGPSSDPFGCTVVCD